MPAWNRAPCRAELRITASDEGGSAPREQLETGRRAARSSGLAHESGPDTIMLAGERADVFAALMSVIGSALEAGAGAIAVKVEVPPETPRFDEATGSTA